MKLGYFPYLTRIGILSAIYFSSAKLGLTMDGMSGYATLVWPPAGISLAALLLFGYRLWPGITLGAFIVSLLNGAPLLAAFGIGIGNTLEALFGTYLLQRFKGFRNSLERVQDVLWLLVYAALLSTVVGATIGVSSFWLAGAFSPSSFGSTWRAWWVGDMLSDLVIAPVLLTWVTRSRFTIQSRQVAEAGVLALSLVAICLVVFWDLFSTELKGASLVYMIFPTLIWASLRFGQRGAVTATFAISSLTIWGTAQGLGPFTTETFSEGLLFLQIFMGVISVTAMSLAAVVTERARSEQNARESEERYRVITETALDAVITIDRAGKILFVNQAAENIFGYSVAEMLDQPLSMIMPEDLRARHWASLKRYIDAGKTDIRGRAVQLPGLHKSGRHIPLEVSFGKFLKDGKHFFTCIIRDITTRKRAEEQIKTSLKEKEVLLKEVHHRVKNNLQVISSMLNLQARHVKDQKALEMFRESQDRVRSVALIHEKLYQTKELSRIDFTEYVRNLGANLVRTYGVNPDSIRLQIHADGVLLSVDTAISCGLIINELVSNSLKYAFPAGKDGEIHIKLRSDKDNQFSLIVGDNGIGLPEDLDFRNTESLGLQLVTTLTDQIGGTVELDRNSGTAFRIVFPESKYKGGGQGNGKRAHPGC